jgi:hypothetical protein
MALACGLTSVRGNRGENYENEPWFAKNIQRKKKVFLGSEGEICFIAVGSDNSQCWGGGGTEEEEVWALDHPFKENSEPKKKSTQTFRLNTYQGPILLYFTDLTGLHKERQNKMYLKVY